jgi:hypothetical protein
MAAFSGTVSLLQNGAWERGTRQGRLVAVCKRISITLAAQGGSTNLISAVSLGFRTGGLLKAQCVLFTDGSSVKRWVGLFTDGTNLYVADPQVVTDADRGKAADVTGTLIAEVEGLV